MEHADDGRGLTKPCPQTPHLTQAAHGREGLSRGMRSIQDSQLPRWASDPNCHKPGIKARRQCRKKTGTQEVVE